MYNTHKCELDGRGNCEKCEVEKRKRELFVDLLGPSQIKLARGLRIPDKIEEVDSYALDYSFTDELEQVENFKKVLFGSNY